jgi:hypothetical protein
MSIDEIREGMGLPPWGIPETQVPIPKALRQRPGDQALPVHNENPEIHSLVTADIEARRQLGISRYGTPLQAENGRNALQDAYEECLDLACYLRQLIEEQLFAAQSSEETPQ